MADLKWKATPKAKIYEAWSAVADGRVKIVGDGSAEVQSSDRAKTYQVVWTNDKQSFGSNDNASFFVGYAGYPIIAVAMALGLVSYDQTVISNFKDINWNRLNDLYKRRYDDVVDYVISKIEKDGRDTAERIRSHADVVFANYKGLKLGRISPPGEPPTRS
ncbi:MAG TPA: hypothetical protein VNW15_01280 [Rhizomicrobium sp.]|jgi:hypothetical protein|nr:hypothetical protein [Rhizomicrobium sp.]